MSLSIVLDEPSASSAASTTYRPGSKVSGHVKLCSSDDEAIAFIDINFTGRCKVKIRKHDHYTTGSYRSRGYYFSENLSLYAEGKYKHKAGTYTWPFSFTIPERASRKQVFGPTPSSKSQASTWRPQRQLNATGFLQPGVGLELESDAFPIKSPWRSSALNALQAHPLPESFSYSYSGFPADFEGRVEYTLIATLTRPPGSILFAPKNLEATSSIILKPWRPPNTRNLTTHVQEHKWNHTVSTLRLLPSNADRRLSLLEKTRSVFNSSSIPSCTFQAVIQTPRYLSPSSNPSDIIPFSIKLSRVQNLPSDKSALNADEIPTPIVKLTSFSLWLRARTLVRDNGKTALEQTVDHEDRVPVYQQAGLDLDVDVAHVESSSSGVLDGKVSQMPGKASERPAMAAKLDLGQILNLRLPAGLLTPDFSTYNIFRAHTLGFKMKLECVGESMDVGSDRLQVRVLPQLSPRDVAPADVGGRLRAPPTPPPPGVNGDAEVSGEKRGPLPPTPPPEPDDELPQYEKEGPEGPLPAFQS